MARRLERLENIGQLPLWTYALPAVAIVAAFVLLLPFGLDVLPDVLIEGLFLLVVLLIAIPVRRLKLGVLEIGWQIFIFGRLIDFMDELFVEPEPIVEPYLSGLLMVVSLSITVAGAYALLDERNDRVEKLEESTTELALKNEAIDQAPVGITIADMTQAEEPLIEVNEGFARTTGYSVAETTGRNCRFLQGEETDPEVVDQMRTAIENDESVQVTVRNYRKDGTPFWNEIRLAPLRSEDGSVPYYVGFQQDVTAREEYQQRLEDQRDSLELLNQMVRHDIRNDLQVVAANVGLLYDHVDDDAIGHLETIEGATKDAAALTETARNLSETMLNDEPDIRSVSLAPSLRREVEEARSTFDDAVVEIDGEIPEVAVEADDMLESVFRNILKNGIQHNDKERPEITVSASLKDGHVEVRIADNGPGVPDELKANVFERGQRGLESEGTGIGTHLVETLVTRYGGDVWIADNDPEGAVFVVSLPIAE